jgi:hypothetical protein
MDLKDCPLNLHGSVFHKFNRIALAMCSGKTELCEKRLTGQWLATRFPHL